MPNDPNRTNWSKRESFEAETVEEKPKAKATAERALASEWAARKGMANRFADGPGAFVQANPLYQDYAMARAHAAWADDTLVTEEEFDAAGIASKDHAFR